VEYNVLLLGDSLMAGSMVGLSQTLLMSENVGFFVMTNSIGGAAFSHADLGSTYFVARAPQILAKHQVDGVVVSLGTNDAGANRDPSRYVSVSVMRAAMTSFMNAYGCRPVFWILPHPGRGLGEDSQLSEVMDVIRGTAQRYRNMHLLDFTEFVVAHGHVMDEVLQEPEGNVHFNDLGNDLWTQMIHEALVKDARDRHLIGTKNGIVHRSSCEKAQYAY
jgi:lysophospholipase L1-like esterase